MTHKRHPKRRIRSWKVQEGKLIITYNDSEISEVLLEPTRIKAFIISNGQSICPDQTVRWHLEQLAPELP